MSDGTVLAAQLAAIGLDGDVEARGAFAVLALRDAAGLAAARDPERRRAAVTLAASHGFATLAIELAPGAADDTRAAVPRD